MQSLHIGILLTITVAHAFGVTLEECKERAAAGEAEALWQLGQRYENGEGVRKDGLKAISQYRKAADKNHARACERLAFFYETGKIVGKDPVKAARYRAQSKGESAEMAAALAQTAQDRSKVDYIEVALDYIIGRNGQSRDAKKGIQLLYKVAKDNPTAQKVFVDRWSKGDLDGALEVLSDDEWQKIVPWYKDAWDSGNKRAGLILGNDAYSRKQYSSALSYWQGSGMAKCWYFVGRFYATWSEEGQGGGPSHMRDETKARKAYEKCLRIDSTWDNAKFDLGCLYLFAKAPENENLYEAKRIFSYFLKKDANNMWYNYDYGLPGYWYHRAQFNKKWPKAKVDRLLNWAKQYENYSIPAYERRTMRDYNRMIDDWKAMERSQGEFVAYIRKAANLGCEPAQKFMSDYNSKNQ